MPQQFAPASWIRYARIDDLGVIADFRSSTYKVLDDIATSMWEQLTSDPKPDARLEAWCSEYDVDPATVQAALANFTEKCLVEGLLEERVPGRAVDVARVAEARPAGRRSFVPRIAKALYCLIATQFQLRTDGFGATYQRYAQLACRSGDASPAACLSGFIGAENWFFSKRSPDDCLLRSLALYRFLRSDGTAAEHVIGVRRIPFLAHAWVECAGTVMLDGRVSGFTPLARIGAA